MTQVPDWVQDIVSDCAEEHPLHVGARTINPDTGKLVEITGGQYWGTYGLSNFWYWRAVLKNGTLSKKEECGYGWTIQDKLD